MKKCVLCPRKCAVDRARQKGFCGEHEQIRVARNIEHFEWEEPCLADEKGTFAIFFSGCNLRCSYCQNHQISRGGIGSTMSIDKFCDLVEKEQKFHSSIDLITPTHFSSVLCKCFEKINKKVPIIWNTSGYESVETIEKVSSFVDIFLTDFKYANDEVGQKFSKCNNYFSATIAAIQKMCELKKDKWKGSQLVQGVIIRHLVLPGEVKNSLAVLDVIAEKFPNRIVSIMSQFTPNGIGKPDRKLTKIEYKTVLTHMEKLSISNGYVQSFESASDDYIPDFDV